MKRLMTPLLLLALLTAAAGCGRPGTAEVTGTVRFNGQTVEDGDIVFLPADGKAPEVGKIKDGKFQLRAKPGKNKVQIRAARPKPGKPDPIMGATKVGYIPAKYNTSTTLETNVSTGQKNELSFDLPR
jgi:hypothetical protein